MRSGEKIWMIAFDDCLIQTLLSAFWRMDYTVLLLTYPCKIDYCISGTQLMSHYIEIRRTVRFVPQVLIWVECPLHKLQNNLTMHSKLTIDNWLKIFFCMLCLVHRLIHNYFSHQSSCPRQNKLSTNMNYIYTRAAICAADSDISVVPCAYGTTICCLNSHHPCSLLCAPATCIRTWLWWSPCSPSTVNWKIKMR